VALLELVFYLTLFCMNAYNRCWPGLVVTAIPFLFRLFKRHYSRVDTVALIIMCLVAILLTFYMVPDQG